MISERAGHAWRSRPWAKPAVCAAFALVLACVAKVLFFGGFGVLMISPDRWDGCASSEGIAVDVRWLAINRSGVKLSVYELGGAPSPWIEAGRKGEARTGPWFTEGSSILMTDREGHVLSRKTMAAVRCKGA